MRFRVRPVVGLGSCAWQGKMTGARLHFCNILNWNRWRQQSLPKWLSCKAPKVNTDGNYHEEGLPMLEQEKQIAIMPKKRIVRCGERCTYVRGGTEGTQCKSKCAKEVGHVISCKCKSH